MATTHVTQTPPLAGRRDWIGLAVLALPLLLVSMDITRPRSRNQVGTSVASSATTAA